MSAVIHDGLELYARELQQINTRRQPPSLPVAAGSAGSFNASRPPRGPPGDLGACGLRAEERCGKLGSWVRCGGWGALAAATGRIDPYSCRVTSHVHNGAVLTLLQVP